MYNELSIGRADLPPTPRISDCTLRDGEQQAGVAFTQRQRVALAKAIDGLGVYELELGTPAVSAEDRNAMEEVAGLGLNARLTALSRARESDIREVADIGMHGVRLSLPISNRQRAAKLPLDDDAYIDLAVRSCGHARDLGLEVIFSPFDTTRAEPAFLARFVKEITKRGLVDRIRLVDTAGVAHPQAIAYLVRLIQDAGQGIPIEMHCHDDLGLATANTIAGFMAGAQYLSTTINGIGERAGNTPTEEVVLALEVAYNISLNLRLDQFNAVSRAVEEASGVRVSDNKAVVGNSAFSHETGPVVAGVLKDPSTAEPYAPEAVGQRREIVLGKQSGMAGLVHRLGLLDINLEEDDLAGLLVRVRDQAATGGHGVSDTDLRTLISER